MESCNICLDPIASVTDNDITQCNDHHVIHLHCWYTKKDSEEMKSVSCPLCDSLYDDRQSRIITQLREKILKAVSLDEVEFLREYTLKCNPIFFAFIIKAAVKSRSLGLLAFMKEHEKNRLSYEERDQLTVDLAMMGTRTSFQWVFGDFKAQVLFLRRAGTRSLRKLLEGCNERDLRTEYYFIFKRIFPKFSESEQRVHAGRIFQWYKEEAANSPGAPNLFGPLASTKEHPNEVLFTAMAETCKGKSKDKDRCHIMRCIAIPILIQNGEKITGNILACELCHTHVIPALYYAIDHGHLEYVRPLRDDACDYEDQHKPMHLCWGATLLWKTVTSPERKAVIKLLFYSEKHYSLGQ